MVTNIGERVYFQVRWCVSGDNAELYILRCSRKVFKKLLGSDYFFLSHLTNTVEFIFIDTNWKKEYGMYCSPPGDVYGTLQEAKIQCLTDDNCVKVLDLHCDNEGNFYLCPASSGELPDVFVPDLDCMYTKPGNKSEFKFIISPLIV